MQLTADILKTPLRRGLGDSLAVAAMMFFGHCGAEQNTDVFTPDEASAAQLDERYNQWLKDR